MSPATHNMGPESVELPAFWVSTEPQGESDALARFFSSTYGAFNTKARGLLKAGARLAGQLKSADELRITSAGSGRTPILTGVRVARSNAFWRADMRRQSLAWFMLECAYIGSGTPSLNRSVYLELSGILQMRPAEPELHALATAYSLRMLSIHGLLADLDHDAVDGRALPADEPVFLLPSGEGVIGRELYNRSYARTGTGLVRLDADRRRRWHTLMAGPIEDIKGLTADENDTVLTTSELSRRIAESGNQMLRTAEFMSRQWKLPRRSSIGRDEA